MSLLAALRRPAEEDQPPHRILTVLDEDPAIQIPSETAGAPPIHAPAFRLDISYAHPDTLEPIVRPYRKQISNVEMMMLDWPYLLKQADRNKLLRTIWSKFVHGWFGFGRLNASRLMPDAILNREAAAALPMEIPFSATERDELAVMLDRQLWPMIFRGITDSTEWAEALAEKKPPGSDGSGSDTST